MKSSPILTVQHTWGLPRAGTFVADGRPYLFEQQFKEDSDEYAEEFLVMEIDQETLDLELEADAIYKRWLKAIKNGEATMNYRGEVLASDQARKDQITAILEERLEIDPRRAKRVAGKINGDSSTLHFCWTDGDL